MKKLLFVIPIVALLAAGCNSSQQTNNPTPAQTPGAQSINSATAPSPTTTFDPTAGWQTYQNTTIGFQLKYPPIFTNPPTETSQGSIFIATFFTATPTTTAKTVGGESLVIQVTPQTASQNVQSDIQNYKAGNNLDNPSDCISGNQIVTTTVQGEEAVIISCNNAKAALTGGTIGSTVSYDFYHNHEHYVIGLSGDVSGNDVLGQIMKSFSFTP